MNDLLKRLLAGETDYEPLLPWNWASRNPAHVNTFWQAERTGRATRKTARRQLRRSLHSPPSPH